MPRAQDAKNQLNQEPIAAVPGEVSAPEGAEQAETTDAQAPVTGAQGPAAGDYPGTADQARSDQVAAGASPNEPAVTSGADYPTHNVRPDLLGEDEMMPSVRGGTDATHGQVGLADTVPPPQHVREPEGDTYDLLPPGAGEPLPENRDELPQYMRPYGVVNSNSALVGSPEFHRAIAENPPTGQQPALDPSPVQVSDLSEEERIRAGIGLSPRYFNREVRGR